MPSSELLALVEKGGSEALRICVYRNRPDVLNLRPELWRQFMELLLDGRAPWLGYRLSGSGVDTPEVSSMRLMLTITSAISAMNMEDVRHRGRTLLNFARHLGYSNESSVTDICKIEEEGDLTGILNREIMTAGCALVSAELTRTPSFERDLSSFLGLMLRNFGYRSLTVDAGIAALEWFRRGAESMEHTGILATLAEMQSRSHQSGWWGEQFSSASSSEARFLLSKVFLAWMNDELLTTTIGDFSVLLDELSSAEFHTLCEARTGRQSPYSPAVKEALKPSFTAETLDAVGVRAAALISPMVDSASSDAIFKTILEAYDGCDADIIRARLNSAWGYAVRNPDSWPAAIEKVADGYARGVALERLYRPSERVRIPIPEARKITQSPDLYPLSVVGVAERALAERTGTQVIPIGSVAARDQWFAEL